MFADGILNTAKRPKRVGPMENAAEIVERKQLTANRVLRVCTLAGFIILVSQAAVLILAES
jgi:hypothetical protein